LPRPVTPWRHARTGCDGSTACGNGSATCHGQTRSTQHRPSRSTRAQLRRTRYQPGRDARTKNAQTQQRERSQHDDQRMVNRRLCPRWGLELRKQTRTNTHNHGQDQHLDARRHHIAQHPLGQERCLVPQSKRHQHKTRQRGQLELDQRHKQLNRQHEEAHNDHQPGQEQHGDDIEVDEHLGETGQVADLRHDGPTRIDTSLREPSRLQQLRLGHRRTRRYQPESGKRAEQNARQIIEVADDESKGPDIQHLLDQLADHVVATPAGMAHGPEQTCQRHVDPD